MKKKNGCEVQKLSVLGLGLAIGLAEAIFMMLFAWGALSFGYSALLIEQIGSFYYGYAPTVIGGLWGALWGFVDGFIFGLIVAAIYNLCACICCKCCKKKK